MTTCPHCHAVTPEQPLIAWDDIRGYEHVKRAVEVALAGEHSLTVYGRETCENLVSLLTWGAKLGLNIHLVQKCPCGNFEDPRYECLCEVEAITAYQNAPAWRETLQADLFVEAGYLTSYKLLDKRKGEPLATVIDRVRDAQKRQVADRLDEAGERLLRVALQQIPHLGETLSRTRRVALSIARLSYFGPACIQAMHLAEAIQYRPLY